MKLVSYISFLAFVSAVLAFGDKGVSEFSSRQYTNPDPGNDPFNFLGYVPANRYTIMAMIAYFSMAVSYTYMMIRYRGYFMLPMLIAESTFVVGIALRIPLHEDPTIKGFYVTGNTLVILSAVGFIAANYILLERLIKWLNCCGSFVPMKAEHATLIFLGSNILGGILQVIGGGISATTNSDRANIGSKISLAGFVLQGAFFAVFSVMYTILLVRIYTQGKHIWARDSGKGFMRDWRGLAAGLYIGCLFIILRLGYRIAEFSQGYRGPIARKEGLFYFFDVLCLFEALVVYIPFWPGKFIDSEAKDVEMAEGIDRET